MTVLVEEQDKLKYNHMELVEFQELICRLSLTVEVPGYKLTDSNYHKAKKAASHLFKLQWVSS